MLWFGQMGLANVRGQLDKAMDALYCGPWGLFASAVGLAMEAKLPRMSTSSRPFSGALPEQVHI